MRRFNLVGITEAIAIGLAVVILVAIGRPALIPAAVCLIVGAHFLPLARIFDQPQYLRTGVALGVVAAVGFVTVAAANAAASRAVVGLGAALVLWATAVDVAVGR